MVVRYMMVAVLLAALVLDAFEQSVDRHSMTMAELKIGLKPVGNIASFYRKLAVFGKALFFGQFSEVCSVFAGFSFDGGKVCLK
jgi:hypothetical protein